MRSRATSILMNSYFTSETFNAVSNRGHIHTFRANLSVYLLICVSPSNVNTFLHASMHLRIAAVRDFYYRLSRPSYMVPIGMITAMTSVPTINAINTMINGSIAARTLCVVISTSSS